MQILYSIPPLLTAVLLVALAMVTFVLNRKPRAHRIFILLCLLGSLLNVDILIQLNVASRDFALRASRLLHLGHPFLPALFIHFFHAYLDIKSRRWLAWTAYAWAFMLAAVSQGDLLVAAMYRWAFGFAAQGGALYPMMALGSAFAVLYNLVLLLRAIAEERRSVQKNRLKYMLAGFGTLSLLTCLNILGRFGYPLYPPGNFGFIPLAIFAAGIFKYDLLDMGLLIRKSVLYTALTALVTLICAALIVLIQTLFKATPFYDSPLLPASLLALIVFVFGPLKSKVQLFVDRRFAKRRYNYQQTIKQASRTISSVLDFEKITRLLEQTIIDAMQVDHCALYLSNQDRGRYTLYAFAGSGAASENVSALSKDAALVDSLEQTEGPVARQQVLARRPTESVKNLLAAMDALNAEVVLPLVFKASLNGFLVLGEKRSGEIYSRDDLDLLVILGHQSAVALENGRAYAALNALNRDLETKVAERTEDLEHALREKERTQEQLVRSESLASLGELVAGVAHELNNPLASVTSLVQSTIEDLEAWESRRVPVAEIIDDLYFADKELLRAKSIVSSLLGLARQTQTYEERVDLNAVVRDALRVLDNRHKDEQLRIKTQFEPDLPAIEGNFANLGQVVINIINNAFQAVDSLDGEINIYTRFEKQARQVVFVCQDNGPGIDDEIREDVFKPFFTTKPVGEGTGLGLYICHSIVARHGGIIDLQPADAHGTVATIRLPVADAFLDQA